MLHLPISEFFLALAMLAGLVMYATYYGCDPIKQGVVAKGDQLIPLFVMQIMGDYPGMPGLFVACVYSAALSTVSSGVNSLAAVTLEDFVKPWIKRLLGRQPSDHLFTIITVASAIFYGLVTIGLAYLAGVMGKTVLQIALSIFGMVGGPLLGLLLVGMFFPCVNSWGAGIGLLCSLVMSFWVGLGAILNPKREASSIPPLNTLLCNITNGAINMTSATSSSSYSTLVVNTTLETTTSMPAESNFLVDVWYRISYQHYSTFSVIIAILVALIVSAFTGFNRKRELDKRTYYDVLGLCCKKQERQSHEADLIAQIDCESNVQYNTKL